MISFFVRFAESTVIFDFVLIFVFFELEDPEDVFDDDYVLLLNRFSSHEIDN